MFFIASKILGFITDPLYLIGLFFILGMFAKRKYRRRKYLWFTLILSFFFSNGYVYKYTIDKWNLNEVKLQSNYDYGILLGGIISLNSTEDKIKFGISSDRMLNTIQLYHSKRINKIIISGASGSLKSDLIESDYLKKYLLTIGIPKNDIICERNSQNTYQNAQYTANYILKNNINSEAKCLLITSDYHQRRALACFKKANLNVDPYIIKLEEKYIYWDTYFIPQSSVLFKWRILMHEIIGYITYKTNNYI